MKIGRTQTSNSVNGSSKSIVDERLSLITGDPKKAIRTLSMPMIVSMLLMMVYNLADINEFAPAPKPLPKPITIMNSGVINPNAAKELGPSPATHILSARL